jgi:hypothetical protein
MFDAKALGGADKFISGEITPAPRPYHPRLRSVERILPKLG